MVDKKKQKGICTIKDDDNWVIEPASPEETAMIKERMKDYERDPSSFVPFSSIK